jgi:uncharacterized Zn finger protein
MPETVEQKARRYLAEGRLVVALVAPDEIRARCRGGGAEYELGLEAGEWSCSCPARGRCAHVIALQLVTVAPAAPVHHDPEPVVEATTTAAGFE